MDELKLYIHGALVEATSNETFDNIIPAAGEVIERTNGTEFGLSAGVFTKDIQRRAKHERDEKRERDRVQR